jgi:hypothetical protein
MRVRVLVPLPSSGLRPGDELVLSDASAALWVKRGWAEAAKHLTRPPQTKAVRGPKETK